MIGNETKHMYPLSEEYTPVEDVPKLVNIAREAFQSGKTKPLSWRKKQLYALHEFLEKEEAGIVDALFKDLRKPAAETRFAEIASVKADIVTALTHLDEWAAPVKSRMPLAFLTDFAETRRVPYGTVLIIGTWNYPVNLTLAPLLAAIAGGNTAVLKFNEISAHTATFLAKNLPKYLDPHAFQYVLGDIPETTALLEQKFELIFYTGNSHVGRIIHRAANKNLTPVVLELGGKSPVIVDEDIDLDIAATRIMWGKVLNNGQTCVAPDYILVHKKVAKGFKEALKRATVKLLGDDIENSAAYGRISCERHFQRLDKLLKDQLAVPGTELIFGGKTKASTRFMEPTILGGIEFDGRKHPIMKDEIFGPILPVIEVNSIDEAISYVNQRPPPLSYNPFSKNRKTLEKIFDRVDGGSAMANDAIVNLVVDDLPFGGVGESGMGNYHGIHGFETFTRKRATMIRSLNSDLASLPRYQHISYDRKSWGFWALMFASEPALPSPTYLIVRKYVMKMFPVLKFLTILGLIGGSYVLGKSGR